MTEHQGSRSLCLPICETAVGSVPSLPPLPPLPEPASLRWDGVGGTVGPLPEESCPRLGRCQSNGGGGQERSLALS